MTEIEGLSRWEWRRKADGTPQTKVKQVIEATYGTLDVTDPYEVARRLTAFADAHEDAKVDLDHKYDSHPDYDCDYSLKLEGWRTVTEAEVEDALGRQRARRRTELLEERRRLQDQLERVNRGL